MKKILSAILTGAIAVSAMPLGIANAVDSDLSYDMDLNGFVGGADAQLILDYFAYTQKCGWDHSEELLNIVAEKGDLNGDGKINATDAGCLLTYIKETTLLGDVNRNGIIQPSDAARILSYYVDSQTYNLNLDYGYEDFDEITFNVKLLGDLNEDGEISLDDASIALRIFADDQATREY